MKDLILRKILPKVSKPARYAGGEHQMIKKDWAKAKGKMALAFPDVYEIGMSNIGGKILYGVINERSDHLVERTFAPWPDMEAEMRKENVPLYTLESFQSIRAFDVVGFSMQYELSITNVLNMLDLAGIPVRSRERRESDPLVMAGGPVVYNPEPFADFFDLISIGDGEDVLIEILDCVDDNRHLDREALYKELSRIDGVYIPALYEVTYDDRERKIIRKACYPWAPEMVAKRVVKDLDQAYYPTNPIVPYINVVHDRAVLEVMRGCQRGCRFCHAGMVYRPVRERSVDTLTKQAREQLQATGYDEISLSSLSTLDYSGIESLVDNLVTEHTPKGVSISLPSLRVDRFSIELAQQVQQVRKSTLTLAPEAGTQRMRDVINKNVTAEQLNQAVESAFRAGWLAVKLYYMIGLPGEREEDLQGILDMLKDLRQLGAQHARRPVEIKASCSIFVPKPHTPFQWQAQCHTDDVAQKKAYLTRYKLKQVRISIHDTPTSYLEGLIARGDRRLGDMIFLAWQKGCKFDGWSEFFNMNRWMEAIIEWGMDADAIIYRPRDYEEDLPWDFIDTGIDKTFLIQENERAKWGQVTGDCRQDGCSNCGVCPSFEVDLDIRGNGACG